ncbi:hypothetical protein GPECTOR_5g205 [Gonium pectorale]|uniref:Uncharacterized protein n=1 Tax=Gonium pectorale TaxID=33097 RepID=A0A150GWL6_GONPE|nr:hypothetical protein GPECTOR_5g205 [Gonium pectorale]|eukprot:KXZ54102.1 hypothetical protein GPECTOR_5g205 [Gonium pectorale]
MPSSSGPRALRRTAASAASGGAAQGAAAAAQRALTSFAALALVALAACAAAQGQRWRRAGGGSGTADSPAIPAPCIEAGLNLQSLCSEELDMGMAAFGVDPAYAATMGRGSGSTIDSAQLKKFLDEAPPPTARCCEAVEAFNNKYCSCSPAVLDLVKSFTNDDINQYRMISKYFQNSCKKVGKSYTLYLDDTCPKAK